MPPILSVGYRFCLAALVLLAFCRFTRKRLIFSLRDHVFMAAQGVTLFGLGYCMSYLATSYMTSGLVSVVYTTILMWNILNLKLFMRQPVAWRAFAGGMLGLFGIVIVFWHDLSSLSATRGLLGLAIFGSIIAFGCYMLLIGRIGAEYAAYVTFLMPIIALLLSTLFEAYHWRLNAVLGVAIVLVGNLVTLTPAATWRKILGPPMRHPISARITITDPVGGSSRPLY